MELGEKRWGKGWKLIGRHMFFRDLVASARENTEGVDIRVIANDIMAMHGQLYASLSEGAKAQYAREAKAFQADRAAASLHSASASSAATALAVARASEEVASIGVHCKISHCRARFSHSQVMALRKKAVEPPVAPAVGLRTMVEGVPVPSDTKEVPEWCRQISRARGCFSGAAVVIEPGPSQRVLAFVFALQSPHQ
eukprot:487539-Lingulodinium_polyedra.AAC.1